MCNKIFITVIALSSILCSCGTKPVSNNPFLTDNNTPYQIPPFEQIKEEHYKPAFEEGFKQHIVEIDAIVANSANPTFENTILTYDRSGKLLDKVANVFFNLCGSDNNDNMQKIALEISPRLTEHHDNILMNQALFSRIKTIYENRTSESYNPEQLRVVEKIYSDFVRSGANLNEDMKSELKKINARISTLQLSFENNILAETNDNFYMLIDNKNDLAGLTIPIIDAAAETANELGHQGKWAFTLQKPSLIPFLQYSENRSLREKLYKAYFMRGNNNNEFDNKNKIKEITSLSARKAEILGYKTYAHYKLEDNMAKTPENANEFLHSVWTPAIEKAKIELKEMQNIVNKSPNKYKVESWDWWHIAEKLRKEKYDFEESELKPYFELNNVRNGMFWVANSLYGITFKTLENAPKYNINNEVFEAFEADGTPIGVLYLDYHPRSGKAGGAWCTGFRSGSYSETGERIHPIISVVCNFTKSTGELPSLLTWDEAETLFHEFGHALHGLFSDGYYKRTAGEAPLDYIELPSQIMENWASEPEVLKHYAKHYITGEPISDELINKLEKSKQFNQGFSTSEIVAASLLDIDWYMLTTADSVADVEKFEKEAMDKIGLIPEILPRYRSTYFSHVFGGGYSAGYYVYLWAEILDADAFDTFKQSGDIFNKELAEKFRKYCLTEIGNDEAMIQYEKFRGGKPSEIPFLKSRGIYNEK